MSPRPPPGPRRRVVEQRSSGLLVVLTRQPRWLLPLLSALLLGGVVFLPALPARACLVVLLGLVGWLSYLSWPVVDARGKAIRVALLALLLVLGLQSTLT